MPLPTSNPWTPAESTRAAALYLPLLGALGAGLLRRHTPRLLPATLLALLWTLPSLLLLQHLNLHAHWWTYAPAAATLRGMPVELYLGWAILWSVLPVLTGPRLPIAITAPTLVLLDLLLMPRCSAAVTLAPSWLVGELAGVLLVLLPALILARATLRDTHLALRAAFQLILAAGLFLYCIPEITFALTRAFLPHAVPGSWQPLLALHGWRRSLALQLVFLLALPGLTAIQEFAQRGKGTPIPYDPPRRLVTSGIYRYLANPMQFSCVLVMLAWALLLRDPLLLAPAALAFIYSAGIATWDEGEDLELRFGPAWLDYRRHVHNWLPCLTPYQAGPPAILYYSQSCTACSALEQWLAARRPLGLSFQPAETLTPAPTRLTYLPPQGSPEQGIRAFARALEHLNLGYALAGAAMRLPLIAQVLQLVMDAAGFGPQTLCAVPAKLSS